MFVDTHCHLFSADYKDDLETIIENAKSAEVDFIIVPATDLETSQKVIDLIDKYDFIYGAVGIHPHESKDWTPALINTIEKLSNHKKIIAIGEIGFFLCWYWIESTAPLLQQHSSERKRFD